ncbi:EscU/YscU/HrcU family type III secretion system export apparatus switch protein [Plastoroseomonas arctica]|uniref:EscU/YscU/HrcU family type III secretion system export apparatus switch protein n=1 Tax=Plastoroseomonas arctica TaxID=1509237 RepID=A0AAF1KUL2_9PROT|nr:EscU/YscU/HrcU family type III secretion system export apparatus switch protein [Plastoroseomonas arctica]MBR0656397.1 EscU/YscU/HrcU family type III secretion system export apparatus switch protein [Plastoroseomonas arctica]
MAEDQGGEDRTQDPSERRLERAREDGKVALSREAVMLATLLAGLAGLMIGLPPMARDLAAALRGILAASHRLEPGEALTALAVPALFAVLPVAGLTALGSLAGTMLQTRGLVSAKALAPDFAKLNPLTGLHRLLGVEAAIELLRTAVKLSLVGLALWTAVGDPGGWQALLHSPVAAVLGVSAETAFRLMRAALAAFAVVAVLDLVLVHLRHRNSLRMSREDMKAEQKEADGDPQVKGHMKQLRLAKSRLRMMAAVPRAAVIITNPTHYAVALAYDRAGSAAPRVVAKGMDAVAMRIREVGQAHGVPIVPNPPLARALHKMELEAEIPPEHYQAVAEIIAFIWRLNARAAEGVR